MIRIRDIDFVDLLEIGVDVIGDGLGLWKEINNIVAHALPLQADAMHVGRGDPPGVWHKNRLLKGVDLANVMRSGFHRRKDFVCDLFGPDASKSTSKPAGRSRVPPVQQLAKQP